jgi:hypothetical protein
MNDGRVWGRGGQHEDVSDVCNICSVGVMVCVQR